jgi:hypothetical protein
LYVEGFRLIVCGTGKILLRLGPATLPSGGPSHFWIRRMHDAPP